MIGLKRGIVKLHKNNLRWVESFTIEKKKLSKIFGSDAATIQHVGSTAITTIFAKPIIDIGVIVASFNKAKQHIAALKEIGYIFKEENRTDRLFFAKGSESRRTHYLHVGEAGSGYIENMIIFRDYLKKHKDIAKEYEKLYEE